MVLLARGLRERGHHVEVVFHRPARAEEAVPAGVEDLAPRFFDEGRWREIPRFRAFVRQGRFDVIHSHRDAALRFCYLATLGMEIPAVVTQRGTVYALPKWGIARWAFRSRKIDRVIAVAEAVKQALVRDGVAAEKVSVVYGGYDPARFHPGVSGEAVRREFELGEATPVVGIVGALVAKKGHADFFEAAHRVSKAMPDVRFLVVGRGKPSRFAEPLVALGLAEHVIFTGHRDDIAPIYKALDVLVCASTKGEGLTGTLREAMAVGTPVVTTDVAGNTEIVRHGETGLVVPTGAPAALADAIVRLLRDRDEAGRLGRAGEAFIRALCINSERCRRVEEIYREIIAGKSKAEASAGLAAEVLAPIEPVGSVASVEPLAPVEVTKPVEPGEPVEPPEPTELPRKSPAEGELNAPGRAEVVQVGNLFSPARGIQPTLPVGRPAEQVTNLNHFSRPTDPTRAPRPVFLDARMIRHSGIGTFIRELLDAWRETDFRPALLGDPAALAEAIPAIERYEVVSFRAGIYGLREQIAFPVEATRGAVLHAPHYNIPLRHRGPLVVSIHDLIHIDRRWGTWSPVARPYAEAMLRLAAWRADRIITGSQATADAIVARLHAPADKVRLVYDAPAPVFVDPAVDPELIEAFRALWRLPRDYFLTVGIYKPHKNLDLVFEALRLLWQNARLPVPLVAAGIHERDHAEVQRRLAWLKMADRVLVLERIPGEQMPLLYAGARALVHPSLLEGFGLPVVEAQAVGTAVLAARASCLPEVAGEGALYFDPASRDDLARQLITIAEDDELREQLIEAGRRNARRFSWKKAAEQVRAVYEELR
jgi:glycosyltransferase involved in cell wall biosynthesis